jgi:ethanolamine permease
MMAATVAISVLYLTFVFSYAELACAVPRAGGAFVYCTRGLGPFWGCLAGLVQIIEFVFAPPAIAMAIGAYLSQRWSGLDPRGVAIVAYLIFTALNAWGVRQAALFELVVTVLAVAELMVFMGVVAPSFQLANLKLDPLPHGWTGAFACVPFAIWFYLAIEGVANAAEEAHDPQRDVPRGFGAAILTLLVLALGVFVLGVGVAGWRAVVYAPGSSEPSDAPLPLALGRVVARGSALYSLLLGVGLLGLVASFHGIILAAGRATMEFGRSGYAPRMLGRIHPRTHTPVVALATNMMAGIVAILSGKTAEIITLSCFGAVSLYLLAMAALFALRRREPDLQRPFRAPGYPWSPALALVLSVASLVALVVYNLWIAVVFAALLIVGVVFYLLRVRGRIDPAWARR